MASAGALSGAYSFNLPSSFLISCFSLLANPLLSLHGVSPATSASASCGAANGLVPTTAAKASAVANFPAAWTTSPLLLSSEDTEHTVLAGPAVRAKAEARVVAPKAAFEDKSRAKGVTRPAGDTAMETDAIAAIDGNREQGGVRWGEMLE